MCESRFAVRQLHQPVAILIIQRPGRDVRFRPWSAGKTASSGDAGRLAASFDDHSSSVLLSHPADASFERPQPWLCAARFASESGYPRLEAPTTSATRQDIGGLVEVTSQHRIAAFRDSAVQSISPDAYRLVVSPT